MEKKVTIIYGDDGNEWTKYLEEQFTTCELADVKTFLQLDRNLFASKRTDTRAETRILKSAVVLVIVTPGHMEFLLTNTSASYKHLVPNGINGIMLFVGITEEQINNPRHLHQTRAKFPNYELWNKVLYKNEDSIKDLLEIAVEIIDKPESLQSHFTVIPTTLQCEEDNPICVMIDEAIPEDAVVEAVIRGTYIDDCKLKCCRINANTYTFVMPKCEEGEASILIQVNQHSLGYHAKVHYRSSIRCSDTAAINEIYCHLLNNLINLMKSKVKSWNITHEEIDLQMRELFDHTVDLPVVGYEQLFGIYQYYTEEQSRSMLPTLVHLAAKHNLKELMAGLQDLPHFTKVISINNKDKKTPKHVAEKAGYHDLYQFMQDVEEQIEIYEAMIYGDKVSNYSNKPHYQNKDVSLQGSGEEYHEICVHKSNEQMKIPQSTYDCTYVKESVLQQDQNANHPVKPQSNYMDMGQVPQKSNSTSDSDSYTSVPDLTEHVNPQDKYDSDSDDFGSLKLDATYHYEIGENSRPGYICSFSEPVKHFLQKKQKGKDEHSPRDVIAVIEDSKSPKPTDPVFSTASSSIGLKDDRVDKGYLVAIQERFKKGELSMEDVTREFTNWQKAEGKHLSNSFEAKQKRLKITKEELSKAKVSALAAPDVVKPKSKGFMSRFKGAPKKPPATKSKCEQANIKPQTPLVTDASVVKKSNSFGKLSSALKQKKKAAEPNPDPLYIPRGGLAPPPPNRQQNSPTLKHQEELYLDLGQEEDENYENPDSQSWIQDRASPRPQQKLPANHSYIDSRPPLESDRNSGASTGSRASASSLSSNRSSGRGSSAGYSSGFDTLGHRSEDIIEEGEPVDDSSPYSNVIARKGSLEIISDIHSRYLGFTDSGLDDTVDDYDAKRNKRAPIWELDLPKPPEVPVHVRRCPTLPTLDTTDTADDCTSSIPFDSPPPLPASRCDFSPGRPHLTETHKETDPEVTPTQSRAAFMDRIGAVEFFPRSPNVVSRPATKPKPLVRPK